MVASHPGFLPQVLSHGIGEESAARKARENFTYMYKMVPP